MMIKVYLVLVCLRACVYIMNKSSKSLDKS